MPVGGFLPRQVDNGYSGSRLALWLFGLVVFMKLAIGVNSVFNGESVASSADGIPLDTYTPSSARTVVSLFALLGLSHVVFGILCIVALVRYRSLIPFLFALLLLEHLGKRLVLQFLPIARTGPSPASAINLVLLALMIVGLVLSLRGRDDASRAASGRSA